MALLCITTTRALHSACKSSDIFPQERSLTTRHFSKESLKLRSTVSTFTVSIKSWRKPDPSKDSSKLCSFPLKSEAALCWNSQLGMGILWSLVLTLQSKPWQDRATGAALAWSLTPLCPFAAPCLQVGKLCSLRYFSTLFPLSILMAIGELKHTLHLPFFPPFVFFLDPN